eukprot:COSAG01_NODE_17385_length_1155_cov_14.521780_1_plen_92_part_00
MRACCARLPINTCLSVCRACLSAELPSVLVCAVLVERVGRRWTLSLGLGGCALALLALSQDWLLSGATALTAGSVCFEWYARCCAHARRHH